MRSGAAPFRGAPLSHHCGRAFPGECDAPEAGRISPYGGQLLQSRVIRMTSGRLPASTLVETAAREALTYLGATDPRPDERADVVIGFGTFDLSLASFCGDLYAQGAAPLIIFTGGFGAGTADLGQPEADAWAAMLRQSHPQIPSARVILENRSTNTAENIRMTTELLRRSHPRLAFERGIRSALIVASPARLRRVALTLRLLLPSLRITRCLPAIDFDRERAVHDSKGIPFMPHLKGELDRIVDYPRRGWIAAEPLPPRIAEAHAVLRGEP